MRKLFTKIATLLESYGDVVSILDVYNHQASFLLDLVDQSQHFRPHHPQFFLYPRCMILGDEVTDFSDLSLDYR